MKILPYLLVLILFSTVGCSTDSASISKKKEINDSITVLEQSEIKITETYIDKLFPTDRSLSFRYPDSLLGIGENALKLSTSINYDKGKAKSKETIGRALMHLGKHDQSLKYIHEAMEYAYKTNADSIYIDCINVLGHSSHKKKEFNKVFEYNQIGLKYSDSVNNELGKYMFTLNSATLFKNIGEHDQAQSYYQRCLKLMPENSSPSRLGFLLLREADNYYRLEQFNKAEKNIYRALPLFIEDDNFFYQAESYIFLAQAALKKSDFQHAEKNFVLAKKALNTTTISEHHIQVELGFAELDYADKNYKIAKNHALNSFKKSKNINFYQGLLDATFLLQKSSASLNDHEQAFLYLKRYQKLSDSLMFIKNENKAKTLYAQAKLNKSQEIKNFEAKHKLNKQRYILFTVTFLCIALIVIVCLVISNALTLKKVNKKLDRTNKNQKKLFSIIGHDLKGPISSLQELLKVISNEKNKDELLQRLLPKLSSYTDHVHFTLNNLLNWGKNQMKGENVTPSTLNLHTIASTVIALYAELTSKKELKVDLNIEKAIYAFANEEDVNVIFRNLLSNAIKFTPSNGQITISAQAEKNQIVIVFTDNGIGMSSYTHKQIFETNEHFTTFGTNNEKGSGLGLMLCIELLKRNNGSLKVKSILDQGSKIFVYLPKESKK